MTQSGANEAGFGGEARLAWTSSGVLRGTQGAQQRPRCSLSPSLLPPNTRIHPPNSPNQPPSPTTLTPKAPDKPPGNGNFF